jgi:hypothetical protein
MSKQIRFLFALAAAALLAGWLALRSGNAALTAGLAGSTGVEAKP